MTKPQQHIDAHTHCDEVRPGLVRIRSFFAHEVPASVALPRFCCVGVHPWHAGMENAPDLLTRVEHAALHPYCVAVGETGLDRACDVPLAVQQDLFQRQVSMARRLQKPVIVHCVRAWSELLAIKKNAGFGIPFVVHGFRGGAVLARQLLDAGMYLSFGAALRTADAHLTEAFLAAPLERLFLESDEECSLDMAALYELAAGKRGIATALLQERMQLNVLECFGVLP